LRSPRDIGSIDTTAESIPIRGNSRDSTLIG
jgi:hypothetical protein